MESKWCGYRTWSLNSLCLWKLSIRYDVSFSRHFRNYPGLWSDAKLLTYSKAELAPNRPGRDGNFYSLPNGIMETFWPILLRVSNSQKFRTPVLIVTMWASHDCFLHWKWYTGTIAIYPIPHRPSWVYKLLTHPIISAGKKPSRVWLPRDFAN